MDHRTSRPVLAATAATAVVAAALVGATPAAPAAAAGPSIWGPPPARYVAVDPVRAVDTRQTGQRLGQGGTLAVDLARFVPATATTAVLNLTVDAPTAAGYLTVYAAGELRPTASNLNKVAGETRSNSVTVALPDDRSRVVDVFNQAGSSDVVVDVVGYYDPTPASGTPAAGYRSYATPFRAFDSRTGGTALQPGSAFELALPAVPGVARVTAVAVNLTAVDPAGPGYLTTWDGRDPEPATSTVNFGLDAATPTFAIVPAYQDAGGLHLAIGGHVSATDVVLDVVGLYDAGQGGLAYVPAAPTRVSDTRVSGILGPNQSYATGVASTAEVVAANLTLTAVDARQATFLSVYPDGAPKPFVSTLNPGPGQIVANATQTALGGGAAYRTYNASGYVDVVADLEGYFVVDAASGPSARVLLPAPTQGRSTRR